MSIGNNINKFREMNKMTQDDLASRLFVTRQTISNYENERSRPDLDMLIQIADVLKVDIKDIIYGKDSIYQKMVKKYLLYGSIVLVGLLIVIYLVSNLNDSYNYRMQVNLWNKITLFPLVCVACGWCSIQLFQICFQVRTYSFRFLKISKCILFLIIFFWLCVVILPVVIDLFVNISFPSWYGWLLYYVMAYNYLAYGLFMVVGILFGGLVDGRCKD